MLAKDAVYTLRFYDRDWQELEDLLIEDCSYEGMRSCMDHVVAGMNVFFLAEIREYVALHQVEWLTVEVQRGRP